MVNFKGSFHRNMHIPGYSWHYHMIIICLFQGILGSVQSGKSALVHRYLTGSYMQEESPEGNTHDIPQFSDTMKLCSML